MRYGYDDLNRLHTVGDWLGGTTTYNYDVGSQLHDTANPNGTAAAYGYDGDGRVNSINHTGPGNSTLLNLQYTYDNGGNRNTETGSQGTSSYNYDALDRLQQVSYPNVEQVTYTYDQTGNRKSLSSTVSGTTAYNYDEADRILNAGGTTFGFDATGRQTSKTTGGVSTAYTFDALDRLTLVSAGTGNSAYVYNGDGIRMAKTVSGVTTSYVQDLAASLPVVLMETSGGQDTLYLYGRGGIGQVQPDGSRRIYHADALGSTRVVSDGSGASIASYTYDAFGAVRSQTGNASAGFTFTGEQTDSETGLEFLRARYYDSGTGRFLTIDPVSHISGIPQTTNRYPYAASNPLRYSDHSGRIVAALIVIGILAIGVVEFGWNMYKLGNQVDQSQHDYGKPAQRAFDRGDYEQSDRMRYREGENFGDRIKGQSEDTAFSAPETSATGPAPGRFGWPDAINSTVDFTMRNGGKVEHWVERRIEDVGAWFDSMIPRAHADYSGAPGQNPSDPPGRVKATSDADQDFGYA